MSKRICSFFLAVLMLSALNAGCAFNASASAEGEFTQETYEDIGLTLRFPEGFYDTSGIFSDWLCLVDGGISCKPFIYLAMTPDDYRSSMSSNEAMTPDEIAAIRDSFGVMLWVMAIDGGRGAKEILDAFEVKDFTEEDFKEIGKLEDLTFYLFEARDKTEAWLSGIEPKYAEEFRTLHDELTEILKNAEFSVPVIQEGCPIGQLLRFETTDLDGNPVKSEELFARHEITMVNTWDTGCVPCIGELEGLNEMNQRIAGKDVAVIGICTDAHLYPDKCRALLEEHHAEYLNLLPFSGIYERLDISAAPTSYFVGRNGRILDYPYIGAPTDVSAYETYLDYLLIWTTFEDPFFQNQKTADPPSDQP